jgi:Holliday junction resolvase
MACGGATVVSEGGSTNEKGDRNEREAANIIGRVRGKGNVEKVDAYSNTDPFGFVDVLAVGEGKVLFVQVKTNRFTDEDRRKYKRKMRRLPFDHAIFEVWVRVDYEGWRMHRYDPDREEFKEYICMDTCDHEETVEAYRQAVGYHQEDT